MENFSHEYEWSFTSVSEMILDGPSFSVKNSLRLGGWTLIGMKNSYIFMDGHTSAKRKLHETLDKLQRCCCVSADEQSSMLHVLSKNTFSVRWWNIRKQVYMDVTLPCRCGSLWNSPLNYDWIILYKCESKHREISSCCNADCLKIWKPVQQGKSSTKPWMNCSLWIYIKTLWVFLEL